MCRDAKCNFCCKVPDVLNKFAKDDDTHAKDNDTHGLYRTGVCVCLNELECVTFASSRIFALSTPREGPFASFWKMFYANLLLQKNTHTHRQTNRQFEFIYYIYTSLAIKLVTI